MDIMVVGDAEHVFEPRPLRLRTINADSPTRTQVLDVTGIGLATLTVGAKSVTLKGPSRTFVEQKKPFHDTFARTRTGSDGWGSSAGGGNWVHGTGTDSLFTADGTKGSILINVVNTSRWATIFDQDIADVDVRVRVTFDEAPTGASCSASALFGYTTTNDHNRARLIVTTGGSIQLALEKEVGGTVTTLGSATTLGTGFAANDLWWIRAQRTGSTIRCRAWKDGTSEPGTWTHSVSDTSNPLGRVGIRAIASTGNSNNPFNVHVYDLEVITCQWQNPPTVTHNTWVRLLDEPYDGEWTPALQQQIRVWLNDCSPDVLTYATSFNAYALPVTDPALSGLQVLGQSQYGPLTSDGGRSEDGDWNDYVGMDFDYPSGEHRDFPHGAITSSGVMDCSGYVRMVYGRCLGMPLTYHLDYDGLNIPRNTADQSASGPGIVVASSPSSAPSLTNLQIGDVLYFDADPTDPVEGTIDHCGIYMGLDTNGHPRFISSRKTLNGPTMADVGGNSRLDGSGNYATRLRKYRRF